MKTLKWLLPFCLVIVPFNHLFAGWFGPDSYAECMKTELQKSPGVQGAQKYVHNYCFSEHCEGKGEWLTIQNPYAQKCQTLRESMREGDKAACRGFPHGAEAGYGGRKSGGENCEKRAFSNRELLDCKCTRWLKRAMEFKQLHCETPSSSTFVYSDKTCRSK